MRRSLPSLAALESFEAVGRLGQVTRAAEELGRTQSAISRQIANLEVFARRPLFARDRKRLTLNESGKAFYEALTNLLDELEAETARLISPTPQERVVSVGVLPTFGSRWLVPRVGRFAGGGHGVDLNLVTGLGPFDLEKLGLDVAIQYGDGNWPGVVSRRLLQEQIVPVISPHIYQEGRRIDSYEWLQMTTRPVAWSSWLKERCPMGVRTRTGLRFENFNMLIEAACRGLGVAVLPTFYIQEELASGALITPFGAPVQSERGYYLVQPQRGRQSTRVQTFCSWLVEACEADGVNTCMPPPAFVAAQAQAALRAR